MRVIAGNSPYRVARARRPLRAENPNQLDAALAGRIPAEALTSPRDRRMFMFAVVVDRLMTDVEIARLSCWSTYTVGRIREACGLLPNAYESERTA